MRKLALIAGCRKLSASRGPYRAGDFNVLKLRILRYPRIETQDVSHSQRYGYVVVDY